MGRCMGGSQHQRPSRGPRLIECAECLEIIPEHAAACLKCGWRGVAAQAAPDRPSDEPSAAGNGAPAGPGPFPPAAPGIPFIGRHTELDRLRQWRRRHGSGRPNFFAIEGAPGVGKTHLLKEVLQPPDHDECIVRWTTQSHGRLQPWAPAIGWIRRLAIVQPDDSPARIESRLRDLAETCAGLTAEDAHVLYQLLGTPAARVGSPSCAGETIRLNIHQILRRLLRGWAAGRKLHLIVDDAQWIDPATAEWLDAALADFTGTELTIWALGRNFTEGWRPQRQPDEILHLPPLDPDQRAELFDALTPALDFLPELRAFLIERSVGTPLFVGELSRLVRQIMRENAGPVDAADVANLIEVIPASLDELIQRRIDRLDARSRQVLEVSAVLGLDCSFGLLECFDRIKGDLQTQLAALEGVEFIRRHSAPESPQYFFIEGHVRDLAYDRLLTAQRQDLHRRVARAIEERFGSQSEPHFATLAFHYEKAGDPERAVYYGIKSADRQARLGQAREAAEAYEGLLEAIERLEPTARHRVRMARVMIELGRLLRHQGRPDDSRATLEAAANLAEGLPNEHLVLQARMEHHITELNERRSGETAQALLDLLEEAARLGHPPAECVILNALGTFDLSGGRLDEALRRFRELAERARAISAEHLEADALNNTGLIYWRWGRYAEAARVFRSALAIRLRLGDRFGQVAARMNLAIIQEQLGEVKPALENYREAAGLADAIAHRPGEATTLVNLSNLERRAGLTSNALDHAARAIELARAIGDPLTEAVALENLALAHAATNHPDRARQQLQEALDKAKKMGAEEIATEIELDQIELTLNERRANEETVRECKRLLDLVEERGWHDLASMAARLKGLALIATTQRNKRPPLDYLEQALDHAERSGNQFDRRRCLQALLDHAGESVDATQIKNWRVQIDSLGYIEML